MATMNISLPDALKVWAESRTDTGMYDTTSDYVRDLIRRDQERSAAIAELHVLIDIGLASGISTKTADEVFAEARATADRLERV